LKRTDEDLIPKKHVKIIPEVEKLFSDIMLKNNETSVKIDVIFNDERCAVINKSLRDKSNTYALDPYGLVIRKKSYNKKSDTYGWKYNDSHQPIHYYVEEGKKTRQENINNVLSFQYNSNPKHFISGPIRKIYEKQYPERLAKYVTEEPKKTRGKRSTKN
jgi:hypothetical protein